MSKQREFINKIVPGALKGMNEYGVLASITLAQAILESGWGKSTLASEHNNLFGIKADNRWHRKVCVMRTAEYTKDNIRYYVNANFRKYDSCEDSIKDHTLFLVNNSRYAEHGFFNEKDYKGQANALQRAGYATSPQYAHKLIELIERYKLYEYDKIILEKEKLKYNLNYCFEFQKWFNNFTKSKISEDGIYGPETEKALQRISEIIRDFK